LFLIQSAEVNFEPIVSTVAFSNRGLSPLNLGGVKMRENN